MSKLALEISFVHDSICVVIGIVFRNNCDLNILIDIFSNMQRGINYSFYVILMSQLNYWKVP